MTEEEKKAIELLEDIKNNSWITKYIMSSDSKNADILLNLITKLQKENEEKDRQIKALVKYIDSNNYVTSNSCDFQDDFKIEKCIDEGNCKECIRKYFEKQAKKEGE